MITAITTNEGAVKLYIDEDLDITVPKGKFTCKLKEGFLILKVVGSSQYRQISEDATIDGVSYPTIEDLAEELSSFSEGGGDGSGVTWSEIEDKPNTFPSSPHTHNFSDIIGVTNNNFIVGGTSGTVSRILNSTDVNINDMTGTVRVPSLMNNNFQSNGLLTSTNSLTSGIIPRRATGGVIKIPNGVANDDGVAFGQILTQAQVENITSTVRGLVTGQLIYQAYASYNKGGVASFTGDDVTESFNIPHGLGQVPRYHICNRNADGSEQAALFTSMADATNIMIKFTMAPASGVIVMINWHASK